MESKYERKQVELGVGFKGRTGSTECRGGGGAVGAKNSMPSRQGGRQQSCFVSSDGGGIDPCLYRSPYSM